MAILRDYRDVFLLYVDHFFRFSDMSATYAIRWDRVAVPGAAYHLARHGRFPRTSPIHTHDFAELFWVDAGSATHQVDGRLFPVRTGDLVLVRPEDVHGFRQPSATFTITNLAFPRRVLDEVRDRYYADGGFPWDAPSPRTLPLAAARSATVARLGARLALGPPGRLRLDRFLLELLDELASPSSTGVSIPAWLDRALVEWRDDPEAMRRGVRGLAEHAGRSREHVSRVIRETTGHRAIEVVNRMRLGAAAAALRMTDQPIAQIAADVGLGSLSHFYELFRASFGSAPGRYRRSHRTVVEPDIADR